MSDKKTQIFRSSKKSNYTIVNNEVLRRKDLSWKAKGMLVYILSLPDDWIVYLEEIMKHSTDGKASFRSGWKELEEKGYVKRVAYRESGKIKEWRTVVSENADLATFSPDTDFQHLENQEVENQEVENRKLLSTYITNNLSIQSTNKRGVPQKRKYGEFKNVLLSEDEYNKLTERFPNDLKSRIERLSGYVASTGKSYKSHYATIINWAKKDKPDENRSVSVLDKLKEME